MCYGAPVNLLGRVGRLFERWSVAERVVKLWAAGRPLTPADDYETLTDEGYRSNTLIYACINEWARGVAQAPLRAVRRMSDGSTKPAPRAPLGLFLTNVQLGGSLFEFLEAVLIHLGSAGNAFVLKLRGAGDRVVGLRVLRPERVRIIGKSTGEVDYYTHGLRTAGTEPRRYEANDVIHLPLYDPLDDWYGLSPISVLAAWGDVDNETAKYVRDFYDNAGSPQGILKLKARVPREQREEIAEAWKEQHGAGAWHTVAVLDSDADYKTIGSQIKDLELAGLLSQSEARICQVYQIPPIVVGAYIGLMRSTYSNYQQAVKSLWQETLRPLYARVADGLARGLREVDPVSELEFDTSEVEALQENIDTRRTWALSGYSGGLMTLNEARSEVGLPPVPDGDDFKTSTAAVAPPPAAGATPAPAPGSEGEEEPAPAGTAEAQAADRSLTEALVRRGLMERHGPDDFAQAMMIPDDDPLMRELQMFFTDMAERHGEAAMDAVSTASGGAAHLEPFTTGTARVQQFIADKTIRFQQEVWNRYAEQVRAAVSDYYGSDASPSDLQAALDKIFEGRKRNALTVARTESHVVANQARIEAFTQADLEEHVWVTSRDEAVRDSHAALDGERVKIGDRFSNGLAHPGDYTGDLGEFINCRCDVLGVVPGAGPIDDAQALDHQWFTFADQLDRDERRMRALFLRGVQQQQERVMRLLTDEVPSS